MVSVSTESALSFDETDVSWADLADFMSEQENNNENTNKGKISNAILIYNFKINFYVWILTL